MKKVPEQVNPIDSALSELNTSKEKYKEQQVKIDNVSKRIADLESMINETNVKMNQRTPTRELTIEEIKVKARSIVELQAEVSALCIALDESKESLNELNQGLRYYKVLIDDCKDNLLARIQDEVINRMDKKYLHLFFMLGSKRGHIPAVSINRLMESSPERETLETFIFDEFGVAV